MTKRYRIKVTWDEEGAWIAESDDLPGLITGHETLDGLMDKLPGAILDLAERPDGSIPEPIEFEVLVQPRAAKAAA